MIEDEKGLSTPHGVPDEGTVAKPKTPEAGEPSTPYGDTGKGTSGGLPSDVEPDPSMQPG